MTDEMILVPRYELLAWSEEWLYENDPGDGTDCVTPFDTYLLKSPVGAHCTTCSCVPGMTPAVRFDTTPAEKERAVRDHLIRMGWTPPAEAPRCTCPSGDGSLRWPCPAHPPEAQPVAWRETVERLADGLYSKRHDARERGDKYDEGYFGAMLKDAETLLEASPPSAPVGVDLLCQVYADAYHHGHHATVEGGYVDVLPVDRDTYWREKVEEDYAEELAQQPAAEAQPVGSVVWSAGIENTMIEVKWSGGIEPPVGTKLYAHPPTSTPVGVGYAKQIATSLWQRHYREDAPQWEPFDDIMGLLTQIDNMACGLQRLDVAGDAVAIDDAMIDRFIQKFKEMDPDDEVLQVEDPETRSFVRRLLEAALAQQPAAVDGAMVERIAALLHEEATDEPWDVAGVEHDGPDRDYYRTLAHKVIVRAGQQGGAK